MARPRRPGARRMADLFGKAERGPREISPGVHLLAGCTSAAALMPVIERVAAVAPFRFMVTPGGQPMSAAMTNCGPLGWVSDRAGYRYSPTDPQTGRPWPAMPDAFTALAHDAALAAGFADFEPDSCLINRYAVGARMGAHQDRDERDFSQPIVSVSLGLPTVFAMYGPKRGGRATAIPVADGDVVVFGGPARRNYHAVRAIKPGDHPVTGPYRFNMTFRKAA